MTTIASSSWLLKGIRKSFERSLLERNLSCRRPERVSSALGSRHQRPGALRVATVGVDLLCEGERADCSGPSRIIALPGLCTALLTAAAGRARSTSCGGYRS